MSDTLNHRICLYLCPLPKGKTTNLKPRLQSLRPSGGLRSHQAGTRVRMWHHTPIYSHAPAASLPSLMNGVRSFWGVPSANAQLLQSTAISSCSLKLLLSANWRSFSHRCNTSGHKLMVFADKQGESKDAPVPTCTHKHLQSRALGGKQ